MRFFSQVRKFVSVFPADINSVEQFIEDQENENSRKKT